jgi:hypothetical protein
VSLVGYLYYKNRASVTAAAPSASPVAASSYQTAGIQDTQAQSTTSSSDIVTWITRAAAAVAGQSATSPSDAMAALTKWYEGATLTTSDQHVVDQAFKLQGTPPVLPQSISPVTPDPVAAAPVAPVSYIRSPNGSIAVVLNNGTKGEFTNYDSYQTYAAQHPLGAYQQVSSTAYADIKTSATDPSATPTGA